MPNCFVPWHEFRSLTFCAHTHTCTQACTHTNILWMQRQMCATTQKWAQVYTTQITASSGKGHHDNDNNNNCASYHSNGLGMCAKPDNENRMSKGDSGHSDASVGDLLISHDLCARTWQPRFCKRKSHYAHYVCLKQQQDTLRWRGEVH